MSGNTQEGKEHFVVTEIYKLASSIVTIHWATASVSNNAIQGQLGRTRTAIKAGLLFKLRSLRSFYVGIKTFTLQK
jgi:hypothetical protein